MSKKVEDIEHVVQRYNGNVIVGKEPLPYCDCTQSSCLIGKEPLPPYDLFLGKNSKISKVTGGNVTFIGDAGTTSESILLEEEVIRKNE